MLENCYHENCQWLKGGVLAVQPQLTMVPPLQSTVNEFVFEASCVMVQAANFSFTVLVSPGPPSIGAYISSATHLPSLVYYSWNDSINTRPLHLLHAMSVHLPPQLIIEPSVHLAT